jgi:drug/metabolite transporter (DMT)-like permease
MTTRPLSPTAIGTLAAVVTVLAWTSFIVGSRAMALRHLQPLDIVLVRVVFAAAVLLPWAWWRWQAPGTRWRSLWPLPAGRALVLALTAGLAYPLLAYNAFRFAPAAHGSVLMPGMLPLFTAVLSVLVLREHLSPRRLAGLALVIAGAAWVAGHSMGLASTGADTWKGDLLFLSGSLTWSLFTVLCRRWQVPAVAASVAMLSVCCLLLLPTYGVLRASGLFVSGMPQAPWSEVLVQGVLQGWVSVVVAGVAFMKMIQAFGPVRSTMITASVPGLSALGAWWLLGEPLADGVLTGLVCVTLGILVGVAGFGRVAQPAKAAP